MADTMRLYENRRIHRHRFTYCCDKSEIRGLKIIAADMGVPVNQIIHEAVLLYVQSNYSQEHWQELLKQRPKS